MAKKVTVVEDDMAVEYPMEGNLVPITYQNLIKLGVSNAKEIMAYYEKVGDEVFGSEGEGCNKLINGMIDDILNKNLHEPQLYHIPEDAQNVSNDKLVLDKAYLDFFYVPEKVWKRIKKCCPDAFHAKWTQYEG